MLQIILQLPSFHTKWRLLCLLFLNIFQHAGKLFMNSLLFMVWEVYFSVSSEMISWTKDTCSFFYNNNKINAFHL